MSYDIYLQDPVTKRVVQLDDKHSMQGGTYVQGGTREAWLNVTYNYAKHFKKVLGGDGVRSIYGKTGQESIDILTKGIDQLKDDVDTNYWKPTEGNARRSLIQLRLIAELRPDGIWYGD